MMLPESAIFGSAYRTPDGNSNIRHVFDHPNAESISNASIGHGMMIALVGAFGETQWKPFQAIGPAM
jgi:hypothetical protein